MIKVEGDDSDVVILAHAASKERMQVTPKQAEVNTAGMVAGMIPGGDLMADPHMSASRCLRIIHLKNEILNNNYQISNKSQIPIT